MLIGNIFHSTVETYGMPSIDIFASRINRTVSRYVSWRPDLEAQFVDAFSCSWSQEQFYAFPPFSLILRCLKKIEMEKGEGIIIAPVWPTQPWYPKLTSPLFDTPRLLLLHMDLDWLAQKTTTNRIISSQGLIIIRSKRNTFIIHNQNRRK